MTSQLTWYAARAAGIVAWALAAGSVVWGLALSTRATGRKPRPAWLFDLHRFLGGLALVFTAIHVIAHLPKMADDLRVDFHPLAGLGAGLGGHSSARAGRDHRLAALPGYSPGRGGRVLSLAGAMAAGLVLAIVVIPQFAPWLAHPHGFHPQ